MNDIIIEVDKINVPAVMLNPSDFLPHRDPITMRITIKTPNGVEAAMHQTMENPDDTAIQIGEAVLEAVRRFRGIE